MWEGMQLQCYNKEYDAIIGKRLDRWKRGRRRATIFH